MDVLSFWADDRWELMDSIEEDELEGTVEVDEDVEDRLIEEWDFIKWGLEGIGVTEWDKEEPEGGIDVDVLTKLTSPVFVLISSSFRIPSSLVDTDPVSSFLFLLGLLGGTYLGRVSLKTSASWSTNRGCFVFKDGDGLE